MARRIFAHQKLVRVHRRLKIAPAKSFAHLAVQLRHGNERIRYFTCMRCDQVNAPVGIDDLFVIRERAFFGGFTVQRRALFFRARELRTRRLPFGCSRIRRTDAR